MAKQTSFWWSSKGLAALGLIGAASYFLFMEHSAHLFQLLPFLIFLLCPLMHLFMHRGHGGHGKESNTLTFDDQTRRTDDSEAAAVDTHASASADDSNVSDDYLRGYRAGQAQTKHPQDR